MPSIIDPSKVHPGIDIGELKIPSLPRLDEDTTEAELLQEMQRMQAGIHRAEFRSRDPESVEILPQGIESIALTSAEAAHRLVTAFLKKARFPEDRIRQFQTYADALWLSGKPRFDAQASLETLAQKEPQISLANEMSGDVWKARSEHAQAIKSYLREGSRADAVRARTEVLKLSLAEKDRETLQHLHSNPLYISAAEELDYSDQRAIAIMTSDYAGLLRITTQSVWLQLLFSPMQCVLTVICAIIWFVMLHQLGGVSIRKSWRGVLGLVLGFVSPIVALFLLALQEHYNELQPTGEIINDLIFYVSGVGLREEVAKLLLFSPLLFVHRGRSDAEILITAGCVGLGFAVAENISYFAGQSLLVALDRFVMANFMHIATTGLCGLALAHWVRFPRSCWERSLIIIVSMIVVHGFYDFSIASPMPRVEFSLDRFAFITLLLLAQYYLTELKRVREARGNTIGPLFAFLSGIALLASCTLVAGSLLLGLEPALTAIIGSGLSSALLIIMFSYHLREL